MPLAATLEGSTYELDEVDLTWTLHEFRDAGLANACGSFKIFDADEWRIPRGRGAGGELRGQKKDDLVGETLSLLQHACRWTQL